jgi:indolepyruvate ferredoxin oxidoreductase beta subunit
MIKNILLVGVGGQGVLLASELLCDVALELGFDVKKSEVHGMAQRGGSVSSHVRLGEKVYSPLISRGDADILLSFEQMETLRWIDYLKESGLAIVSTQKIVPMSVAVGSAQYPVNVHELVSQKAGLVDWVDALEIANNAGNIKAANVALVGALSAHLEQIPQDVWEKAIQSRVPAKYLSANIAAFRAGRDKEPKLK